MNRAIRLYATLLVVLVDQSEVRIQFCMKIKSDILLVLSYEYTRNMYTMEFKISVHTTAESLGKTIQNKTVQVPSNPKKSVTDVGLH